MWAMEILCLLFLTTRALAIASNLFCAKIDSIEISTKYNVQVYGILGSRSMVYASAHNHMLFGLLHKKAESRNAKLPTYLEVGTLPYVIFSSVPPSLEHAISQP
jgi:hypothetical protein